VAAKVEVEVTVTVAVTAKVEVEVTARVMSIPQPNVVPSTNATIPKYDITRIHPTTVVVISANVPTESRTDLSVTNHFSSIPKSMSVTGLAKCIVDVRGSGLTEAHSNYLLQSTITSAIFKETNQH
jgi:hypothetical protein